MFAFTLPVKDIYFKFSIFVELKHTFLRDYQYRALRKKSAAKIITIQKLEYSYALLNPDLLEKKL